MPDQRYLKHGKKIHYSHQRQRTAATPGNELAGRKFQAMAVSRPDELCTSPSVFCGQLRYHAVCTVDGILAPNRD